MARTIAIMLRKSLALILLGTFLFSLARSTLPTAVLAGARQSLATWGDDVHIPHRRCTLTFQVGQVGGGGSSSD
ncbi:hypothetical protein C8R44DRAFT_880598 [Mycena epipterygia]|nr:hypothetical protein C8R44DRAFT_880598 [Mycena epipterygia]